MTPDPEQLFNADHPSDAALLRLWLEDPDCGETFIAVYGRFREAVRDEMESAGLAPREAEDRVGAVFIRAEETRESLPVDTPLRARLLAVAREVAADPAWTRPGTPPPVAVGMDAERLAALLDGTLTGGDRTAAIAEIGTLCDDDLGVFAEAMRVLRDRDREDGGGVRPVHRQTGAE